MPSSVIPSPLVQCGHNGSAMVETARNAVPATSRPRPGMVPPSLYEGSGNTTIKGTSCKGSVDAINPVSGSLFYGGATISHGIIYAGNMDGRLYAIGT